MTRIVPDGLALHPGRHHDGDPAEQGQQGQQGGSEPTPDAVGQAARTAGDAEGHTHEHRHMRQQDQTGVLNPQQLEHRAGRQLVGDRGDTGDGVQRADRQVDRQRHDGAESGSYSASQAQDSLTGGGDGHHRDKRHEHSGGEEAHHDRNEGPARGGPQQGREDEVARPEEQGEEHQAGRQDGADGGACGWLAHSGGRFLFSDAASVRRPGAVWMAAGLRRLKRR